MEAQIIFICEFCESSHLSMQGLKRHQNLSKACIEVQTKLTGRIPPSLYLKCRVCEAEIHKDHIARHIRACSRWKKARSESPVLDGLSENEIESEERFQKNMADYQTDINNIFSALLFDIQIN